MFITLHCGGMPFNGDTIKEKSLGGSESAAYYMAKELAAKGHKVSLFTNTDEPMESEGVRYIPSGIADQRYPMGKDFHFYAENTPCDVLIIQRYPSAFNYPFASKINLWWTHDLGLIRTRELVQSQMWNVDGILAVSEWHKKQLVEVYGLNEDIVYPITNGVDLSLFEGNNKMKGLIPSLPDNDDNDSINLLFSSRPERGLENLVKPKGIMEKLYEKDKNFHLYVCSYDNTTADMRGYYEHLWDRCNDLPNVTILGSLTKQELADVMRQCDMQVYPSNFEETSCITAMENMAAGLPLIASAVGALPETTEGSGATLIGLDNGQVNEAAFINAISVLGGKLPEAADRQRARAPNYSWTRAMLRLEFAIGCCLKEAQTSHSSILKELIHTSDYYAAQRFLGNARKTEDSIATKLRDELNTCYAFTKEKIWDKHYADYYQYEESKGVVYGPEDLGHCPRFNYVAGCINTLSAHSVVLDYGCAHGHYTINLAKQNPDKRFIGIDIAQSNIDKAKAWAEADGVGNVSFYTGRVEDGALINGDGNHNVPTLQADCVIAAEVLEHVRDPIEHIAALRTYVKEDGRFILTTPYGPWEAIGYKKEWPWRAHVHHFEREDLHNLWGHFPGFEIVNVPAGKNKLGETMGSYVTMFINNDMDQGTIDYERKLDLVVPKQTVSCCMIVKDSLSSIRRCLESVMPYVDELVIGFDEPIDGESMKLVVEFMYRNWPEKAFNCFSLMQEGVSPLEVGFDAARNSTIEKANGDWILWIDADEELHNGHNLLKYLRSNQYNGYAIPQHHFTMEPVGVLKTDLPCRLFRNHKDIKFHGKVHEHPEIKLNEGVGHVTSIDDVSIRHDGYTDEETRRKRFSRNIDLMTQDRFENPDRILGKFLWIRDLGQMCQWELEANGANITAAMVQRANDGIALFHELMESGEVRYVVDALEFMSALARIRGGGFEMSLRLDTSKNAHADSLKIKEVFAYFPTIELAEKVQKLIFDERTKDYGSKYL